MAQTMLAVDIGASSGRVIAGQLAGGRLTLHEVYRFDNGAEEQNGHLVWNTKRLLEQIIAGLCQAHSQGLDAKTLAIDTWGVDYVLLNQAGEPVAPAYCYRDIRTQGVCLPVDEETLYHRTGIQKQPFNTIYQLAADSLQNAQTLLMMPEYLNYCLTGVKMGEYTNASTTGLVNARTHTWDKELLARCGYPAHCFLPLHQPGERVGCLLPEIQKQTGMNPTVVLAPSHDTASAVLAAPLHKGWAYLSSGTWSLLGLENDTPMTDENSRLANMTNEGGVNGTIRYLKNIMGLWMVQRLRGECCPQESFARLAALAEGEDGYPGRVNANDPAFLAPASMKQAIEQALSQNGYPLPQNVGQAAACVFHSLADCYSRTVSELEHLTGKRVEGVAIVGGGSQNDYLNRLTAKALNCPVTAGPVEATAIGNLLAQLYALGEITSFAQGRQLARASFEVKRY